MTRLMWSVKQLPIKQTHCCKYLKPSKDHTRLFLTSHHYYLLQMLLLKFNHEYSLVDLRLDFKTAIHVETGYRNTTGHVKVASYRLFTLLKRMSAFVWSKIT